MVAHLADGLRLLVVSDFGGEDRIELHRLDGSQPAAVLELEPESLGRVEEHLGERACRSLEGGCGVEKRRRFGLLRRELQRLRDRCAEEQRSAWAHD